MKKVVIVGGGASGLVAAIFAARNNNEVLLLERNNTCGKKLQMTGNGRCNYYNEDQNINHYHSSSNNLLKNYITKENLDEVLHFFDSIGIVPTIKNGYYYPYSNQATSVLSALLLEAKQAGVIIQTNTLVTDIIKENEQFKIKTEKDLITADVVILSTGSKAYPKTGSDGMGYTFATKFNHTLIKPLPGLVQLEVKDCLFKEISGIRTHVNLTLIEDENEIKKEEGELQFTDYGISGICAMQLSFYISKGLDEEKDEKIKIDFLPFIDSDVKQYFENRNQQLKNRTIEELLEGLLPYQIIRFLLKQAKLSFDSHWQDLNENQKGELIRVLKQYEVCISNTKSFDQAQICVGGISLDEVNEYMESKLVKNLYLTGELVDVNGDCGGYNLTFAWISGYLAGSSIKEQ